MAIRFINREEELKKLKTRKKVCLVFGRRRVGKTRLVKEFAKTERAVYLLTADKPLESNLERFSKVISEIFTVPGLRFSSFMDMFKFLATRDISFVIIDEFGYVVEHGGLAEFQEIVDEILKNKLILTGSSISLMETRILGYKSPLYGRIDTIISLQPLKFRHILKWFSPITIENAVKIYACCDGIPRYLEFFSGKNIEKEIKNNFFSQGFLFYDARKLIEEELREKTRYFIISEAIAHGKNKMNEIAGYTKIEASKLPFYLENLRRLKIVSRKVPLLGKKKGAYAMTDNYFNFWFKFVFPYEDEIDSQMPENALSDFDKNFNMYLGNVFEKVCTEFSRETRFFDFTKIDKWWHKDKEIDIVALHEAQKKILFAECKWQDNVNPEKVLHELEEKSKLVEWNNEGRKEYFAVFAKSFKKKTKEKNVFLFDLKDMEKAFRERY